jgi:hypothetical protein
LQRFSQEEVGISPPSPRTFLQSQKRGEQKPPPPLLPLCDPFGDSSRCNIVLAPWRRGTLGTDGAHFAREQSVVPALLANPDWLPRKVVTLKATWLSLLPKSYIAQILSTIINNGHCPKHAWLLECDFTVR